MYKRNESIEHHHDHPVLKKLKDSKHHVLITYRTALTSQYEPEKKIMLRSIYC